jgi:hypothetical protein
MELTTFHPTRFGNWIVKLSYTKVYNDPQFILIAQNIHDDEVIAKFFSSEMQVVNFVNFLGEKYA